MKLTLETEREQFAESITALLDAARVPDAARAWAAGDHAPGRTILSGLAELGVTGLAVPEEHGGLGAEAMDLVTAFRVLGEHAVPGPLVESIAFVPTLFTGLSDVDDCAKWLPELASGAVLASVRSLPLTPYALDADLAAVLAVLEGERLCFGTPAASLGSVDPTRRLFEVDPEAGVRAEGPAVRAAGAHAFELGALACAAQLLGLGTGALRMAVEYAKARSQFGRPIGSFQAVKHQLAEAHIGLELARPLVHGAAITLSSWEVSAAKRACARAADRAGRAALQVHGAIGYTSEHELSLWLTKIRALCAAWGGNAFHRDRVLSGTREAP
ncbi:acyl-CoA dehydrogenase family protein [Sciscionella marina]|uniref:acyl-CoA dehydrogenase family protein n=1 Tax=Sciscionella marina TaxID=508770 RepID=UPI00037D3B1D|nr:acyl-CoA dehydrogenase family protein [Sciscionella marina]